MALSSRGRVDCNVGGLAKPGRVDDVAMMYLCFSDTVLKRVVVYALELLRPPVSCGAVFTR